MGPWGQKWWESLTGLYVLTIWGPYQSIFQGVFFSFFFFHLLFCHISTAEFPPFTEHTSTPLFTRNTVHLFESVLYRNSTLVGSMWKLYRMYWSPYVLYRVYYVLQTTRTHFTVSTTLVITTAYYNHQKAQMFTPHSHTLHPPPPPPPLPLAHRPSTLILVSTPPSTKPTWQAWRGPCLFAAMGSDYVTVGLRCSALEGLPVKQALMCSALDGSFPDNRSTNRPAKWLHNCLAVPPGGPMFGTSLYRLIAGSSHYQHARNAPACWLCSWVSAPGPFGYTAGLLSCACSNADTFVYLKSNSSN